MLRSMNGKPVVVCNRCLYVRETSMDNMRIVDFKHPRMDDTHDDWVEGLLRIILWLL